MYLNHFGFEDLPFRLTPDTGFFFRAGGHQQALNVVLVALRGGEGFIKITGEVGTGKTTLCRLLLSVIESSQGYVSAYIPNPMLTPAALFTALAEELHVEVPRNLGTYQTLRLVNARLLELAGEGKRVALVFDEVQAMPHQTLEALRLISNLETEKAKLIQVVMFGQPELDGLLRLNKLRQLRQRIAFSHQIPPLDRGATAAYVAHRFYVAGRRGPLPMTRAALHALHRASGGIPRLINILGHKALLASYGAGSRRVTWHHIRAAVRDDPATLVPTSILIPNQIWGAMGAAALLVTSLGVLYLGVLG